MYSTTFSKTNQITIPAALRRLLGLAPGTKLAISADTNNNRLIIEPLLPLDAALAELDKRRITEEDNTYIQSYAGKTSAEMREIIAASNSAPTNHTETKHGL